jgi:hypothetical protein
LALPGDVRAKLGFENCGGSVPRVLSTRRGQHRHLDSRPWQGADNLHRASRMHVAVAGNGCEEPVPRHDAVTCLVVDGAPRVANLTYLGDLHLCLVQSQARADAEISCVEPGDHHVLTKRSGLQGQPLCLHVADVARVEKAYLAVPGARVGIPLDAVMTAQEHPLDRPLGRALAGGNAHVENRSLHALNLQSWTEAGSRAPTPGLIFCVRKSDGHIRCEWRGRNTVVTQFRVRPSR